PLGFGDLLRRRSPQRRLLHDELRPRVREVAGRLPRRASPGQLARAGSDVPAPGLGASPVERAAAYRSAAEARSSKIFVTTIGSTGSPRAAPTERASGQPCARILAAAPAAS